MRDVGHAESMRRDAPPSVVLGDHGSGRRRAGRATATRHFRHVAFDQLIRASHQQLIPLTAMRGEHTEDK
ncbi:hypothetical protein [Streptomyces rhizosphaericus]|uniref:Uncharacterized protein n=1 Tax=Streptomyces rhizosphaericus TaxID=114699 RepID=A0A6G4AWW2_9ACTN|nr:hypothetical protein [Streptomyces rhizosphaericus]NEW77738.1 hypothetical protein [Streptomyces rhizosphaericus]